MMMLQGSIGKGGEVGGAQLSISVSRRHAGSENAFPWFNCVVWWNFIILVVLSIYLPICGGVSVCTWVGTYKYTCIYIYRCN